MSLLRNCYLPLSSQASKGIASRVYCMEYRGVEQWLARWAHNPKAGGSNPSPANFLAV
jgi:hypothetical protein